MKTSSSTPGRKSFGDRRRSVVEVRVQHAHPADAVHGQAGALGRLADSLGVGAIVDAEGLAVVLADVGMHPGHPHVRVLVHHTQAGGGPLDVDGNLKTTCKSPFDHVTWHSVPP